MKTYGGVDVQMHIFLTSALVGGEWSASRPGCFTPGGKSPGTHWTGGWVGPRTGLDDVETENFFLLPGLEIRPLGRPARRQSLYLITSLKQLKLVPSPVIGLYISECYEGPRFKSQRPGQISWIKDLMVFPCYSWSTFKADKDTFVQSCSWIKLKLNSVTPSKRYRPSDRRLLVKLVPTFADRECRVVSATDSHGHCAVK
jgi:hypothetical protein